MKWTIRIFNCIIICLLCNVLIFGQFGWNTGWVVPVEIYFLFLNVIPSYVNRKLPKIRHRICADGCELLILFCMTTVLNIVIFLASLPNLWADNKTLLGMDALFIALIELILFLNGISRVYCTSVQIGVKWRVIGIACGWIPIVNLIVLRKLIYIASWEAKIESEIIMNDRVRIQEQVCDTKYPVFMVHGIFFRDFKYFNYWGRIPKELESNGARIYYGNHQSAASVAECGEELRDRIFQVLEETGAEKVNVIAHSKGGLDTRYAISKLGMDKYVASLTTINTPHRGCIFADYLLGKIPQEVKNTIAEGYNATLHKLGDPHPDFLAGVNDLTASACEAFNQEVKDMPGVYYQSVGSRLNKASGGRFPLNFSEHLVKHFDGPNDGLVSIGSFEWGSEYTFLTTTGKRGISHGDMIDLNRENIIDFNVREFYVQLVQGLKEKGF